MKIQVSLQMTIITGTFHEDLCTFLVISLSVLLRIRNVSVKVIEKNQNTHFMFNNSPPPYPTP
jgi:hypothetical protein